SAGSPRVVGALLSTAPLRQITLRAGAALDARRVNQYVLTLRAACHGEEEAEGQLFVRVTPARALRCAASFASTEGDTVQVPADVAPWTPLYTVVPCCRGHGGREVSALPFGPFLQFYLKTNDTPLVLSERGTVLAPASGFDPRPSTQVFRLEIAVTDRHGHNCSGAVTVQVLPSRRPRVNFTESWRAVTVPEGTGPLEVVTQVRASGDEVRYAILTPAAPALFTVDAGERGKQRGPRAGAAGTVRAGWRALQLGRGMAVSVRLPWGSQAGPGARRGALPSAQCHQFLLPASLAHQQLHGTPLDLLDTLSVPAAPALRGPPAPQGTPSLQGTLTTSAWTPQVNATLDYDSELAAAVGFQFAATVVVTAAGQPPRSTRVPVLVTVTPVNEYAPQCPNGTAFAVPETAAFGTAVGRLAGTDRDYPPHSIEYGLEERTASAQPFSIDARTGNIYVVGPLDYGRQKSYRLTARLTDTHNDVDPAKRRSCLCDVAVRVQAVLGEAPVCTPEVQELRITSKAGGRQPVTRLACQGSREAAALSYAIVRGAEPGSGCGARPRAAACALSSASCPGNEDRHFRMEGNTLLHVPNGPDEPRTFVLLVEVWGGTGVPRRSTAVVLVVHVTPQSTTVPPRTPARRSTRWKEPVMVTRTEAAWSPPAWFVAALTASAALLVAALGCAARTLLR
ncbi:CDHR4 protein, partial [Nothocercus nigrocapillus]|nr:CDHR4 protein [Nothocercus nigrocapillus]